MRFNNPNEYGDAVLYSAGCTCKPKRVIQVLDDSGAFVVEHYHQEDCAKEKNSKLWHARLTGSVAADTSTQHERYLRRLVTQVERGEIEPPATEPRRDIA
jgi:hypothetical protein